MSVLAKLLPSVEAEGNLVRDAWDRLHGAPGGDALFHLLLRVLVPYTGSLGARVLELRPGYAEVELVERFAVRNHLRSIHAVALANLVELCGNIGVMYGLPDDARFIVSGMDLRYDKKARGRVRAVARTPVLTSSERRELEVEVEVLDATDTVVCRGTLHTLVGPKVARSAAA